VSLSHSPSIITQNLVLCLDAANTKSFKGDFTNNLVPQSVRQHTGGVGPYFSGVINANNTEQGLASFKVTTANNIYNDGFIAGNGGNLTNGVTYTLSADVWVPVGKTIQLRQRMITGGGARSGSQVNHSGVGAWTRISKTFVADTNTSGSIEGVDVGPTSDVFSFWVRNLQLEQKPFATAFFDGTTGTTSANGGGWLDLTGNSNNGSFINGPYYNSSNNGSIIFNGINDYSTTTALPGSFSSFSVIVWFYPTQVVDFRNVLDCNYAYNATTGNIGPRLEMNTAGSLRWAYSNITNDNASFYSHNSLDSGLSANTWHCAVITYDGVSNSSVTYYNGNNSGISRTTIGSPTGFIGVMNTPNIGRGFSNSPRYFQGRVSNVSIYNRALTAQEIQQNYNATRSRYGI